MKHRVNLDTMTDIYNFINAVSCVNENVVLEDEDGHRVSAKSLLGALYSLEWNSTYCCCDKDISGLIIKWII